MNHSLKILLSNAIGVMILTKHLGEHNHMLYDNSPLLSPDQLKYVESNCPCLLCIESPSLMLVLNEEMLEIASS